MRSPLRASFAVLLLFLGPVVSAQAPSAPSAPPADAQGTSSYSSSVGRNNKPLPVFLILGTVFNEKDLAFPGVQVCIRRTEEKKLHCDTYTNSRGEFAMRVLPGYDYEVVARIKHYEPQSRNISSKSDVQQRLSIRLEPVAQAKTGAKP